MIYIVKRIFRDSSSINYLATMDMFAAVKMYKEIVESFGEADFEIWMNSQPLAHSDTPCQVFIGLTKE